MNFFEKVKDSIYSPEFYSEVPKQSFGTALKYFFLLILLVSVLSSINPIWQFLTVGQKEIEKFTAKATNIYPSDLSIKIQNGKLSTNAKEPYIIPMSEEGSNTEGIKNLVVIDTKTPFTVAQFNKYQTIAWVTGDSIMVKDENKSQFRAIDLTQIENFTLNKQAVNSFIDKATPFIKLVVPIVIAGILVGLYIAHIFLLFYLLFVAVLIWALLKIIRKPLSYGEAYKVGMYAITLELLLGVAMGFFDLHGFPFMSLIVTLLVVLFNFQAAPSQSPKPKTKSKKK